MDIQHVPRLENQEVMGVFAIRKYTEHVKVIQNITVPTKTKLSIYRFLLLRCLSKANQISRFTYIEKGNEVNKFR